MVTLLRQKRPQKVPHAFYDDAADTMVLARKASIPTPPMRYFNIGERHCLFANKANAFIDSGHSGTSLYHEKADPVCPDKSACWVPIFASFMSCLVLCRIQSYCQ